MSVHYSPDPAVVTARPDVDASLPRDPDPRPVSRFLQATRMVVAFLGITFAIGVLFFVPVCAFNLARIEALEVSGELVPVSVFVEQLGALFLGTLILALAFTSFVANLLLHAGDNDVRPRSQTELRSSARAHLAVLRFSGLER